MIIFWSRPQSPLVEFMHFRVRLVELRTLYLLACQARHWRHAHYVTQIPSTENALVISCPWWRPSSYRILWPRATRRRKSCALTAVSRPLTSSIVTTACRYLQHLVVFYYYYFIWCIYSEDVPLVEFMYLVFTRMPGESYRRRETQVFVVVAVLRIDSYLLNFLFIFVLWFFFFFCFCCCLLTMSLPGERFMTSLTMTWFVSIYLGRRGTSCLRSSMLCVPVWSK